MICSAGPNSVSSRALKKPLLRRFPAVGIGMRNLMDGMVVSWRIGRSRTAVVRGSPGMFALAGQCGRHQSRHTDQVVRGSYEVARELRSLQPDVARASEPADRFHPAEDLLDQFAFALTDGIPDMPRGAPVDRAAPPTGVLRYVGRHLPLSEVRHAALGVVPLIRRQGARLEASFARLVHQIWHGVSFSCTGRLA